MSALGVSENFPQPIPPEDLPKLFPLTRPEPIKDKSYEFAFVLAGTVSAGAYTAGVLDYILEALDAWTRAKEAGSADAPTHNAILSTICGASGGAINGAIFSRVAGFAFPHGAVPENPFYDIWVRRIGLNDLLAPQHDGGGLRSLFNTAVFDDVAGKLITLTADPLGSDAATPHRRSFLADPLRLTVMVANVTGIPYQIGFRGESRLGHDLIGHMDFTRFALTVPGGVDNTKLSRPDEFALSAASALNWNFVSEAALCTSAFPAAFPSRPLHRPFESLGYRVAVVPGVDQNTAEIAQLIPSWKSLNGGVASGMMRTVNVDGGTLNNEPLDAARIALAGYNGRNERDGAHAIRGVVMIDPFSDAEGVDLFDPPGFLKLLGPLVSTLVKQARFKPEDIALATDYDTFSRFLIAPVGVAGGVKPIAGSGAIAAGALGGFSGFIDERFLDYDFRLGRHNAHTFLTNEFVLPRTNAIFAGTWTAEQIAAHKVPEDHPALGRPDFYLPIIPLMPQLKARSPSPPTHVDWPRVKDLPADFPDRLSTRLDSIYAALKRDLQASNSWPGGLGAFALNQAYSLFLRGALRDKILATLREALGDQNLLPRYEQIFSKSADGLTDAYAARANWLAAGALSSTLVEEKDRYALITLWNVQ